MENFRHCGELYKREAVKIEPHCKVMNTHLLIFHIAYHRVRIILHYVVQNWSKSYCEPQNEIMCTQNSTGEIFKGTTMVVINETYGSPKEI